MSVQGHVFYVVTAGTADAATSRTYVYDLEEDLWVRWAFQAEKCAFAPLHESARPAAYLGVR